MSTRQEKKFVYNSSYGGYGLISRKAGLKLLEIAPEGSIWHEAGILTFSGTNDYDCAYIADSEYMKSRTDPHLIRLVEEYPALVPSLSVYVTAAVAVRIHERDGYESIEEIYGDDLLVL